MNSEKQSDKWEKISYDENLVKNAMQLAERDIKTANDIYNNNDFTGHFQ